MDTVERGCSVVGSRLEMNSHIEWIRDNLSTRDAWDLDDYREFYERDVRFLLSAVERLQAESTPAHGVPERQPA
jgi:hypothetical protein